MCFSPNSRILVVRSGGGSLAWLVKYRGKVDFWDVASKSLILRMTSALEENVGSMSLSPDGKLLAVSTNSSLKIMKVYDVSHVTAGQPPGKKP